MLDLVIGMLPKYFFISAISALLLYVTMAAKVKFTNVKCETYNETWVTVQQCRLRAVSRYKTVLNIDGTFHYPATKINIRLQVLKKANGYKPWLVDATIDACAFMRRRNHPVAKIFHDWIKNFSSATHTCPYVGHQYVRDFYLTPDQIPLPLPTGDYAIFVTGIFSDVPQYAVHVYATFVEDLIKQ